MAKQKLNQNALGYTLALLSAAWMLVIGILGSLGIYTSMATLMQQHHLFFSLSFVGIIAGIIEAAIWGMVFGWIFAWIYNQFA